MTAPVMLPLMFIAEMILIKRIWKQKMRLRHTINEVWLHKSGEEIEVVYLNRFFVVPFESEKNEERALQQILPEPNISIY